MIDERAAQVRQGPPAHIAHTSGFSIESEPFAVTEAIVSFAPIPAVRGAKIEPAESRTDPTEVQVL